MREDIGLRFALVAQLHKMRYGDSCEIDMDRVSLAWPPTGDADPSMEAGLLAMSIAARGGTPIPTMTTEERIERDLDSSFAFERRPDRPAWTFHRRLRACPECQGSGWKREAADLEPLSLDGSDLLVAESVVRHVKCDHRRLTTPIE